MTPYRTGSRQSRVARRASRWRLLRAWARGTLGQLRLRRAGVCAVCRTRNVEWAMRLILTGQTCRCRTGVGQLWWAYHSRPMLVAHTLAQVTVDLSRRLLR